MAAHECTRKESIHLNPKEPHAKATRHPPQVSAKPPPRNEDKFGIDFWHAVEFSRSGRTPTRRLSATRRGNPSSLGHRVAPVDPAIVPEVIATPVPGRRASPSGAGRSECAESTSARPVRRTSSPTCRPPGLPGALTTVAPPAVPRRDGRQRRELPRCSRRPGSGRGPPHPWRLAHRRRQRGSEEVLVAQVVRTVDYHTGGEPFRIVARAAGAHPRGERRAAARPGHGRSCGRRPAAFPLSRAPGHADMYGGFLVPPDDEGAHLGVLFWHKDGFSTACGHGPSPSARGRCARGWSRRTPGHHPTCGSTSPPAVSPLASMHGQGRLPRSTSSASRAVVAHTVPRPDQPGTLAVDIGFGGAFYAHLDVASLGLTLAPGDLPALVPLGREVKWALDAGPHAHTRTTSGSTASTGPCSTRTWAPTATASPPAQRRRLRGRRGGPVAVRVGNGVPGRRPARARPAPAGNGADPRLGGRLALPCSRRDELVIDGREALVPVVTGTAFPTGEHLFVADAEDELAGGFLLR